MQGVADAIASVIVAGNTALDQVVQTDQSGPQFLTNTASIELAMQGAASTAVQQAANSTARIQSVPSAFTGTNLSNLITAANNQLGPDTDTESSRRPALQSMAISRTRSEQPAQPTCRSRLLDSTLKIPGPSRSPMPMARPSKLTSMAPKPTTSPI